MLKKNNLIWIVFYFLLLLIFLNIVSDFFGLHLKLEKNIVYKSLFLGLPVVLLILHSLITLSTLRAVFFITLASFTGWVMEVWGLSAGTFFGGHYVYKSSQLTLMNIPLSVILYWAVFIYTGYCVVNSFIYWLNKQKPRRDQRVYGYYRLLLRLTDWLLLL